MKTLVDYISICTTNKFMKLPDERQMGFVGVTLDKKVDCFYSASQDAMDAMGTLVPTNNPYRVWRVTSSYKEASDFASKLVKHDLSCVVGDPADQHKRDTLFSQLSEDTGVLTDFFSQINNNKYIPESEVKSLVAITKDYTTLLFKSDVPDVMGPFSTLVEHRLELMGWKVFSDDRCALEFSHALASLRNTGAISCPGLSSLKSTSYVVVLKAPPSAISSQPAFSTPDCKSSTNKFGASGSAGFSDVGSGTFPSSSAVETEIVTLEGGGIDLSAVKLEFGSGSTDKSGGMKIFVSHMFPHKNGHTLVFVVTFQPPSSLYHWQGNYAKLPIDHIVEHHYKPKGIEVPYWMLHMRDMPLCQNRNPELFKRTGKGYVKTLFTVVGCMRKGLGSPDLHVHKIVSTFASGCGPTTECGQSYALWLKQNKERVYQTETGETGSKKKITHEAFVKSLHTRLVKMFEQKTTNYNTTLDIFMTYGHIKEFFVNHCGYESWHDVPVELKKYVLTKWQSPYPDWDTTEVKSFSD